MLDDERLNQALQLLGDLLAERGQEFTVLAVVGARRARRRSASVGWWLRSLDGTTS